MRLPARSGRYQQNPDTGELQPFAREPIPPVATAPPEPKPKPVAEPPAPALAFFTEPTPEPTEAE